MVFPEDDHDIGHPQDLEDFSLEVGGKLCLPRNVTVAGLAQQNDFQGCALAPVEAPACCSSWNESQLPQQGNGNGEFSNWAMERSGSYGIQRAPKISLPLTTPSLWQQVYSKTLKKRERLVDEKLQRKMQGRPKKKAVSLEKAMHPKSIPVIKKVKMSMRVKADQDPNSDPAALPPDEAIAKMFGVDAEDCHESSSDDSSVSGASSRMTSPASHHSSITSDKDVKEKSSKSASNGQKDRRKSRKWFRLANNKVAPL